MNGHSQITSPAGIYLLKVNNRNTRTRCEICSKFTIKTPENQHLHLFYATLYNALENLMKASLFLLQKFVEESLKMNMCNRKGISPFYDRILKFTRL